MNYIGYMLADANLRLEESLDLITKALDIEPGNGAYLDSLGWVQFRLGRLDDAEKNFGWRSKRLRAIPPFTITWRTC